MPTPSLLETISSSSRLSDLMAWPLDFDVSEPLDDDWFQVLPDVGNQVIAHDGTGGVFAFCGMGTGENRPVLFVSSEGQAGIIAHSLKEALQLIIAHPHWIDYLKFSRGGTLPEMREASAYIEAGMREDKPEIDDVRQELFREIGLEVPIDPIGKLHDCITDGATRVQVLSADGSKFVGLINGLVGDDRPAWG